MDEPSQRHADEDARHALEVRFRVHCSTSNAQRSHELTPFHELSRDLDTVSFQSGKVFALYL
jgi:hypothetical protein